MGIEDMHSRERLRAALDQLGSTATLPPIDDQWQEMPAINVQAIEKAADLAREAVDHPPHYNKHPSGVECIDVVEHMTFNVGNAMKYLWRADHKNDAIEDLKKASWYIEREIKRRGG